MKRINYLFMKMGLLAVLSCIVTTGFSSEKIRELVDYMPKDENYQRTKWLRKAKWGILSHHLSDWLNRCPEYRQRYGVITNEKGDTVPTPMNAKIWNEIVDGFDVETLANQVKESGAGYYMITVSQMSGYFLSPNKTYDRLTKRTGKKSLQPKRDLIKELAIAMKKRGVRFGVYLAFEEPKRGDTETVQKLLPIGRKTADGRTLGRVEAYRIFARNWLSVLNEFASRWGTLIDCWVFDGAGVTGALHHDDEPNYETLTRLLRKANPATLISYNHAFGRHNGQKHLKYVPVDDFYWGENGQGKLLGIFQPNRPEGQLFHNMTYLGSTWYHGARPKNVNDVTETTRQATLYGGAITWDVGLTLKGTFRPGYMSVLKEIDKAAHYNSTDLYRDWQKKTSGGRLWPKGNIAYMKPAYMINETLGWTNRDAHTVVYPPEGLHAPQMGVDNDKSTYARPKDARTIGIVKADKWAYAVDLIKVAKVRKVKLEFAPNLYPQKYQVKISLNGADWKVLYTENNYNGQPLLLKVPRGYDARWIRISALTPAKNGGPMAISDLQVYEQ